MSAMASLHESDAYTIIKGFLEEAFLVEFVDGVGPETNLFRQGIIDSYGYVELVVFLEKTFKIKISDDDQTSGALASLAKMTALVNEKRA